MIRRWKIRTRVERTYRKESRTPESQYSIFNHQSKRSNSDHKSVVDLFSKQPRLLIILKLLVTPELKK